MNQSNVIFGFIAVAFLLFITQRGELPIYWGFLVASPKAPAAGPTATASGKLSDSEAVANLATVAQELGPLAMVL
jgi:hypothetical protein